MSTVTQTIFNATLTHKKTIARDLLELRFEKPDGFMFKAGQFLQFHIPEGDKMVLRSYSISSISSDPYLELCVKLLPQGKASTIFAAMQVDDGIRFQGPQGRFTNPLNNASLVYIATGAGLAPIMSMIEDELKQKKNTAPIQLLFGIRSEEDMFWTDRLDALTKNYKNFHYQLTLSQPKETWNGATGRVTAHTEYTVMPGAEYYLCGSMEMVKDVRNILGIAGVDMARVHFEIF